MHENKVIVSVCTIGIGRRLGHFGSEGYSTGQFQHPCGVAINQSSLLMDTMTESMQMFTMESMFVKSVGQILEGTRTTPVQPPIRYCCPPSGRVFVADWYSST